MQEGKGHCRHGEFILTDGCPQCIEENRHGTAGIMPEPEAKELISPIVKVQFFSESTGEISPREYTYFSEAPLKVGDIVSVPVRTSITKAKVSAVDVDESEIAAFKDKVKTIPAPKVPTDPASCMRDNVAGAPSEELENLTAVCGAITKATGNTVAETVEATKLFGETLSDAEDPRIVDTKINLCDTCISQPEYPMCSPRDVGYGDGVGNDNIIKCENYKEGPIFNFEPDPEVLPPGGLAEAAEAAGAEVTVVEAQVAMDVWKPGEDVEARGYYSEGVRLLDFAHCRVIATAEDAELANDDLSLISKLKKAMENKRKSLLDPLKIKADDIRETYNYLMGPVLGADKITRDKMKAHNADQERIRAEQEMINALRLEAAQKEAALSGTGEIAESVNLVEVMPAPKKNVTTGLGSTGQRNDWKFEVVDESAIPREYLMVDTVMLNSIARGHHDKKPVAGIRFFNEPTIVNRPR